MLDKDESKRIIDQIVKGSKATDVFVSLTATENTHLRFARNGPSTSGNYTNTTVSVKSTFGKKSGAASTNQLDDASIRDVVARSERFARLAPDDPETMPGLGPQSYLRANAFRDSVLERGAEQMAKGVAGAISDADDKNLIVAGFAQAKANVAAIGNGRGLFGYQQTTDAYFSETARTQDGTGSGWASGVGNGVEDINFARASQTAIQKAELSAKPQPLAPGKYVAILEPACVANLVANMVFSMNARNADEGRSFFSQKGGKNRLGERLFAKSVNIHSDPTHVRAPGKAFSGSGLPHKKRAWIEDGRVGQLAYDRFWAQKKGMEPVPTPSTLTMAGGTGTVDDLVRSTKNGVLITSLWYIRALDPRSLLYTGLTRDGVFLIKNGKIIRPVTNFRWNDSPIAVLKGIEAMSSPVRVSPRPRHWSGMSVPALRVKSFELSSVSDAV